MGTSFFFLLLNKRCQIYTGSSTKESAEPKKKNEESDEGQKIKKKRKERERES